MHMNLTEYFRALRLPETEFDNLSHLITSWKDFCAWLDRQEHVSVQPRPTRIPIQPPAPNRSWKIFHLGEPVPNHPGPAEWEKVVDYRRRIVLALTLVTTVAILLFSDTVLRAQRMPELLLQAYLVIYGIMTYFLASSFYKLILGAWHSLRGPKGNPWHPIHQARDPRPGIKTAVVFPVFHEDMARVAAGMAATWRSIYGLHPEFADIFDFFLLSDSREIAYVVAEQMAVYHLGQEFQNGRLFYRRRPVNQNAKMGNLTDFCRRWGNQYEYMLVMDADSVMDGDAVVSLLRMIEGNHRIGILQTNPKPILRTSLFGRMQQFGARLYGSVFSYSLQTMYMGHASYIGHNAIVRMQPFIKHCILPSLPGKKPWGGKPLSHDIVESAMMARAGYEVWFLSDIEGTYEEIPANILGFLVRERRWMQGNLQHLRFILLSGLRAMHRETFINGFMAYASAPLWALFLLVSNYGMVHYLQHGVLQVGGLRTLELPTVTLLVASMVFLFMPRMLALAVHIASDKARLFGGKDKLLCSVFLETVFSFFFSPIMMIFITRFFFLWLKQKSVSWGTQNRGDDPLRWSDCWRYFGWSSALGVAFWFLIGEALMRIPSENATLLQIFSGGWVRPDDILFWFIPILGGIAGSIYIARITSLSFNGIRKRRLFCIPEELHEPEVITEVLAYEKRFSKCIPDARDKSRTIEFARKDKAFFVHHYRQTRYRPHVARRLLPKIRNGDCLTDKEMLLAFTERSCFSAIHH